MSSRRAWRKRQLVPPSVTTLRQKSWELLFLSRLKWNIAAVTGFDYVDHVLQRVAWGENNPVVRRHAHTLVSVCYTGDHTRRLQS
uniref:Uncharacterized protein n=1 Tax=Timema shepardi TaxID=629360 RepID=A0A7R9ANS1_TIMSH|nr:unnamed protein product [Timema shepardi]